MADYHLDAPCAQAPLAGRPYHEWTMPDGSLWLAFHRAPDGFLLRFPDLADFRVGADGRHAACTPVPGTPAETCEHLYLNQVLPLMLSRQGRLVFHASAVTLGQAFDDGAVAFLGASGRGKSTLAAAFALAGARFLTDDGMELAETPTGFEVLPSHPSIRLCDDSRAALLSVDPALAPGTRYAAKERLPAQARLPHCDRARPLRAAFFVGEGRVPEVTIQTLTGAEAMVEWVRHAFVLDLDDRPALSAHFAGVGGLAAAVPCYRLDYPRRFDGLDAVRGAVTARAGTPEPCP